MPVEKQKACRQQDMPERVRLHDVRQGSVDAQDLTFVEPQRHRADLVERERCEEITALACCGDPQRPTTELRNLELR